ncbi:MAG: LptF/LptG family permease [Duncaniella sp.]|nr:LptF/LptG family permease [Duncaniella sp.]
MLRIKRMDLFILQSFLPLFVMTFCICLFIVLMQFLWRYIDDMVGKGLGIDVLGELFFYAAMTMVPMALPLAILLASLMIFGNLGENFELTAMKASGISLLRTMAPLIILMAAIATGAFFFQNDVLPIAQTKMWTLLYSVRQKSPEVEIPEGVFYDQIPGYNLYVEKKDRETGVLYDMKIYNISRGFENSSVILADSGKMAFTPDKTRLFLQLWSGESFENLRDAGRRMNNVPYRRESFSTKEIMLNFDANFNRMDEQGMRSQYVGKNMAELQATIDSVSHQADSAANQNGYTMRHRAIMEMLPYVNVRETDTSAVEYRLRPDLALKAPLNVDSIFRGSSSGVELNILNNALARAQRQRQDYEFKALQQADDLKTIRRHSIELQKKFTLSFACIIFFFIGAPLGAIIRKGGLGTPLVISVFLFIFYYIIDNMGYKMARDGKLPVWQGMWLSAAVLLPMGIFFTYKAVNDSAVFNKDAYMAFFRRLLGVSETRNVVMKEVVIEDVRPALAAERLARVQENVRAYLEANPVSEGYRAYWLRGYDMEGLMALRDDLEQLIDRLSNSRSKMVINTLMDFPVLRNLWIYRPSRRRWLSWAMMVLFPVGLPLWLVGRRSLSRLRAELETVSRVAGKLVPLIAGEAGTGESHGQGLPANQSTTNPTTDYGQYKA